MAYVLFADPAIRRFHLHDRLADAAMRRGHRVALLAADPTVAAFWQAQALPLQLLPNARWRYVGTEIPIADFAEHDCRRAGMAAPSAHAVRRRSRRLVAQAAGLLRLLEVDPPDVVYVHEERGGLQRLVHFLARAHGIPVLHTGEGCLPGTMLWDREGIDGDGALCRRRAADFRQVRPDSGFLDAVASAWVAGVLPLPVTRRLPVRPALIDRGAACLHALRRLDLAEARRAFGAWREAIAPRPAGPTPGVMPPAPFVGVLVQPPDAARVRLDAPPHLTPGRVVAAVARAARRLDPDLRTVALLTGPRLPAAELRALASLDVATLAGAPPAVLVAASALVTVNHPLALGAMLLKTPVVHLGRAPWAIDGIATRATLDDLDSALRLALAAEATALHPRFLTHFLQRDHIWCDADAPDRNGLLGLVESLEQFAAARTGRRVDYRPGPTWPLSAHA